MIFFRRKTCAFFSFLFRMHYLVHIANGFPPMPFLYFFLLYAFIARCRVCLVVSRCATACCSTTSTSSGGGLRFCSTNGYESRPHPASSAGYIGLSAAGSHQEKLDIVAPEEQDHPCSSHHRLSTIYRGLPSSSAGAVIVGVTNEHRQKQRKQ